MASIFLSYSREDAVKAKALAKSLERAGHNVWWDRHIDGGAEFSGEIEAALQRCDVILVLWSEASLRSAWVRDEAAEGRDSGRLVPVLLDASTPPLGFRQLQSISIAGWSGRGNPPQLPAIQSAIAARTKTTESTAAEAVPSAASRRHSSAFLAALAGIVLLILGVGSWWMISDSRSEAAETPVLAVLPFSDLSPEGNKGYLGEGVAEAILTVLAKEPGVKVIGRNSAKQLQEAGSDSAEMRRALGITHILEGSARSIGNQLRMSVRLVNAADGQQLWAEEYDRRLDNIFAVQDEIGRSVAQKLRGSFESGAQLAQPITKADTYALYLAARSKMRDRRQSSLIDGFNLARRVIAADPNYGPGEALYAELIWHLSVENYGTIPHQKAKTIAQRHARRAIQLAPDAPDGYAALGLTLRDEAAIEPLKKAIALDPARAELRQWLGHSYADLGRHDEALEQFRATVEMDPLWVPGAMLFAYTLAASERYDESERSIAQFERRGGSRAVAAKIRGDVANYRGDYSEAARLSELALQLDPETPQADLSAGWYNYMLGLHDRAAAVSSRFPLYTRLMMSGQQERLIKEIRDAGPRVWQQPDNSVAVEALAFARDWPTLSALVSANPDIIGQTCANGEAMQMAISLGKAAQSTGQRQLSERVVDCVRDLLTAQGRGPIRSSFITAGWLEGLWAQVYALEGNPDQAFARLDRAIARGVRLPFGRGLSELPVFDPFRSHPEYDRIDARLKQLIANDRAEALSSRRSAA